MSEIRSTAPGLASECIYPRYPWCVERPQADDSDKLLLPSPERVFAVGNEYDPYWVIVEVDL